MIDHIYKGAVLTHTQLMILFATCAYLWSVPSESPKSSTSTSVVPIALSEFTPTVYTRKQVNNHIEDVD